jgi:hypothetical protein
MQRAQQEAIFQQSNINLLEIRISELSYFSTFYLSLGAQSTLVLGFAMNTIVQVQALSSTRTAYAGFFWIVEALLISASMHNLVVSLFSYIYGYRLALNGPAG